MEVRFVIVGDGTYKYRIEARVVRTCGARLELEIPVWTYAVYTQIHTHTQTYLLGLAALSAPDHSPAARNKPSCQDLDF